MTTQTEQAIEKKLNEIYTLLVGLDGQPNTGFIGRTDARLNNHGERIGSLERWRWLIVGGSVVVGALIGFVAKVL